MNNYQYNEVFEASVKYFNGDELAATTWINKYCLKTVGNDEIIYHEKSPEDMHRRLAKELYRIERKYKNPLTEVEIFNLLDGFKYVVPQGGSMAGIGNDASIQSLSNCFVVGNEGPSDSYGGIFKIDQELVQLMKRRGGVGTDMSNLRPANTKVTNAALTSSGVVSFMERYSNSTREVAQSGRRGALMLSISILHPDAEAFIDAKLDTTKVTGANISVKVTDEFMEAVKNNNIFVQRFPINATKEELGYIDKTDGCVDARVIGKLFHGKKEGTYYRYVDARKLWNKIVHNAWKSAEPGVLFWDTIIRESPADIYSDEGYRTTCTNPCLHPDTLILMADGSKKRIVDVVEGDKVVSYNTLSDSLVTSTVIWSGKTKSNAKLVKLDELKCTPDHLIYDPTFNGYREASMASDCLYIENNKLYENGIDAIGIEETSDVYDITLDNYHNFFANGILVHNCGELPLCPYDSCRLFAINLASYVINPWTNSAKFDFDKFQDHVYKAQRLMDDLVDLEIEKIKKILSKVKNDPESPEIKSVEINLWERILEKAKQGRRTGLGVTGEGDMLAEMGLQYASLEAIEFSKLVHKNLAIYSYMSSIDLAKERGGFPKFNQDIELDSNHPFLSRIDEEIPMKYNEDWRKYGRRNIANLTLAPTGSTSILTQTTSGIEPAFRVIYKRRRKTSDKSKAVFIDRNGDMFEEYTVFHHKFVEWYQVHGGYSADLDGFNAAKRDLENASDEVIEDIFKKSPYYKSTANDLDWVSKVRMQGEIQKWIDHSISCTVNVPKETTEEIISKIYETAWESGCKGVTIYRDGSRDGVLISTSSSDKSLPKERPEIIKAKIIRFRNGSENWVAFIGIVNDRPWEIFTGKVDDDIKYLPKSITEGEIKKVEVGNGSHRYDFIYEVPYGYKNALPDIGNAFNPEYYNYARFVSASLQEGTKVSRIVNVLNKLKCGDTINIWNKGVARALKQFIENGTKSGQICDKCGAELVYYNGCTTCPGCGQGGKCD